MEKTKLLNHSVSIVMPEAEAEAEAAPSSAASSSSLQEAVSLDVWLEEVGPVLGAGSVGFLILSCRW